MKCARSIRFHAWLPLHFWAEVVDIIIIYLLNRGPSSYLDDDIPEEAWTGKKEIYTFLNAIDCEEFVYIDKKKKVLEKNPRSVIQWECHVQRLFVEKEIEKGKHIIHSAWWKHRKWIPKGSIKSKLSQPKRTIVGTSKSCKYYLKIYKVK